MRFVVASASEEASSQYPDVGALDGVELVLLGEPGCPEVVCFGFFYEKSGTLCFFFASSSVIIAFVASQQLCRSAIRTNTPCGVRYVVCHVQVASLLSFPGVHGVSGVPISALLGCSAHTRFWLCVCSSHVSGWLTSVEVFAAVPLGLSCFLSCWAGRYFVARWNVGAQAGCFSSRHSDTGGRVMRARHVFWGVGSQWHGCKCS